MTCKDCMHYEVCDALEQNGIRKIHPTQCGYYKNKSDFAELKHGTWQPRRIDVASDDIYYLCSFCGAKMNGGNNE